MVSTDENRRREETAPDTAALLESIVELQTNAQSTATLAVIAEMVSMLRRKRLLDGADVDRMLAKLEAMSAATSARSPAVSKHVADAALVLRHSLVKQTDKPN